MASVEVKPNMRERAPQPQRGKVRRVALIAVPLVVAAVLGTALANWVLANKDAEAVLLEALTARHAFPMCGHEMAAGTLRVVVSPRFMASSSAQRRESALRRLGEMLPRLEVLDEETYQALHARYRETGLERDVLELIGDAWLSWGLPSVLVGERFYSTTGRGWMNDWVLSSWWFGAERSGHGSTRGKCREGVQHLDPLRLLPSKPDYVPIGEERRKP